MQLFRHTHTHAQGGDTHTHTQNDEDRRVESGKQRSRLHIPLSSHTHRQNKG